MDINDKNDDFLGENIDEIFDSQFNDDSKKKDKENDTFIIDDEYLVEDEISIEDEDDIYVLEEPGIEVVSINKPKEETEERKISDENDADLSSYDMDDDFELLEKEFESVENNQIATEIHDNRSTEHNISNENDSLDDDPLDLEDEFVNMKPPEEAPKEVEDLDEFVLESHQYSENEEEPPPIPSISKDGDEFVLDTDFTEENSIVPDNEIEQSETDGRFFDSTGKPVNDAEILQSERQKIKKINHDSSDSPSQSVQRAKERIESNYKSPMTAVSSNNTLFEKKNLLIGGSVLVIVIIAVIFFIMPTSSGKTVPVQKKEPKVDLKKQLERKMAAKEMKKKAADQDRINKLFSSAKKKFENGEYLEAKKICSQAISIKSSEALLFLEREINGKIESIKKAEQIKLLEKKDISDYDKALARNKVEAFEKYLKNHPEGKFFASAKSMIIKLTKLNYENRLKQIINKANSLKQIRLRAEYAKIGKATIQEISRRIRVTNNLETQTIEGDKVIIDYSTGLMWITAKYKMKLDKARIWAVRHYAGYYNWRFPTTEEVFSLKNIELSYLQKQSFNGYTVWTGDKLVDSSYNWILNLGDGKFSTSDIYTGQYLLSVRTIK